MPGITNEHDLTPLLNRELRTTLVAGSRLAPLQQTSPSTPRERWNAVRRMLDSVSGLGWSVIGFVLGAVFWHFVGFWGFVANVVVAGPAAPPSVQAVASAPRDQLVAVADASAVASPVACTALFLDRATGLTSSQACDGDQSALQADSFQGREDRLVDTAADDASPDPARHVTP